jgi:hypothetical protein
MSIETTHGHAAALRRSDLFRGHNATHSSTKKNGNEAYAQGNSYGVKNGERAGFYRQVTPTELRFGGLQQREVRRRLSRTMAGYSETPLAKKLGIKEGCRVALVGAPSGFRRELVGLPDGVRFVTSVQTSLDVIVFFVKSQFELTQNFTRLASRLSPAGMLWIAWPKKASGVATDLSDNSVREIGLDAGLVDVKVCAVNEIWSGLKFVIRVKDRPVGPH